MTIISTIDIGIVRYNHHNPYVTFESKGRLLCLSRDLIILALKRFPGNYCQDEKERVDRILLRRKILQLIKKKDFTVCHVALYNILTCNSLYIRI